MTKTYGSVVRSLISLMLVGVIVFVASPLMSGGKQQTAKAESRATNWLLNGSFENLTGGVPDNWTIENSRVNLGVTVLGGCTSVDTVDYAGIWTRSPLYGAVPVFPFPNDGSALKPTNDNDPSFSGTFTSSVNNTVDVVSPALAPTDGTNTWYMRIANGSGVGGHVVHGGSLVSDEFKAVAGQVITMDWFSAAGGDDFAVLGYLLNTATCTQTTVFETTGTTISSWQNAFVTIPATADTYRFVFVSGTFDRTGGTVSGSKFWLDNISQGAPQTITMDLSDVCWWWYQCTVFNRWASDNTVGASNHVCFHNRGCLYSERYNRNHYWYGYLYPARLAARWHRWNRQALGICSVCDVVIHGVQYRTDATNHHIWAAF